MATDMLTREQVISGEYDLFFHGQRMVRPACLSADMLDHDLDDTGGIVYWRDGRRTSWWDETARATSPNWQPFRRPHGD